MFKWVSWALRILATALLLSFLCIWTTGYIVNSYMESVIKQLDLPIDTQPFALSGVWGTLWGVDKSPHQAASEDEQSSTTNGDSNHADEAGQQPDTTPGATNAADDPASASPSETTAVTDGQESPSPTASEEAGVDGVAPGDAVPVMNGQTDQADQHTLTDAERQALYATVVGKLDPSQLQLLSDALEGSLTTDKLNQLKAMLETALTDSEYAQMMEVLQGTPESDLTSASE
ncbi:hypothetical protein [Cohnella yongneupensis]|uniref:Uncharacterized protein n=1 Tax=Cohnella yongneupensis TaxID=425006 RepID=A0ABW0QX26_9BACL